MKTPILLVIAALTGSTLAQGPLTPPPGADPSIGPVNAHTAGGTPQATMKTLHQIEPRTAIAGGTSSVTLNQSGAYYLTGNITVASGDGIVIAASGVNLDLNGFNIMATAAAGSGISFGAVKNIIIRNGNIGGGFAGGVRYVSPGPFAQRPLNVRVSDLTVSDVTEVGISIYSRETNSHIERCMVSGTGGNVGIVGIIGTVIKDCSVQGAGIIGRVVKDCSVATAPDAGLVADVAENCYASATGTAIIAKCLVNSYGTGGGNSDVISAGVAQNVWAEGGGGSGDGVHATVVSNSYGKRVNDLSGASTGDGIDATIVHGSYGTGVSGAGVRGETLNAVRAVSDSGAAAAGLLVTASVGSSVDGYGVSGQVINGCQGVSVGGMGIFDSLNYNGVISYSMATSDTNTAMKGNGGVIVGSNGIAANGGYGIYNSLGTVISSHGLGPFGGIAARFVAHTYGKGTSSSSNTFGIEAVTVTGSTGLTNADEPGISAEFIHGSTGYGNSSKTTSPFAVRFDSN